MTELDHRDAFVLMPFQEEFDDVYMVVKDATSDPGLGIEIRCTRADEIARPGHITEQIIAAIRSADIIVADITGANPNVDIRAGLRRCARQARHLAQPEHGGGSIRRGRLAAARLRSNEIGEGCKASAGDRDLGGVGKQSNLSHGGSGGPLE